jgi:hypothetical protein
MTTMAELKTKENSKNVTEFLNGIENEIRKEDAFKLLELIQDITGEMPRMWGASIIGFGSYHYKYPSGREGDWFVSGFAVRKQALTLYLCFDLNKYTKYLEKLGKHKTGKGCLYIKSLDDIDMKVLKELIRESSTNLECKA